MTVDFNGPGGADPELGDWPPGARVFTIRSAGGADHGLSVDSPITATELSLIAGDSTHTEYCCVLVEPPIKHRITAADITRYEREYCDRDDEGDFFMVHIAVLGTRSPHDALVPGARGVRVDIAYVVDLSLEEDSELDPAKVTWMGPALVDVADDTPADAGMDTPEGQGSADDAPSAPSSSFSPPSSPQAAGTPPGGPAEPARPAGEIGSSEWIRLQLDVRIGMLGRLAGEVALSQVPVPTELAKGEPQSTTEPQYVIDGNQFWYHTRDPQEGFVWKTTTNPNELIYWCVDDVARGLAWRWTQQAPTYKTMSPAVAQRTLWAPYWQLLMNALDTKWGAITGRNIRRLV